MESGETITNMAQAGHDDGWMYGSCNESPMIVLVVSFSSDGSVRVSPIDSRVLLFASVPTPPGKP